MVKEFIVGRTLTINLFLYFMNGSMYIKMTTSKSYVHIFHVESSPLAESAGDIFID